MNELTNKFTKRLELIKPLTTKPPYYTYEKKNIRSNSHWETSCMGRRFIS